MSALIQKAKKNNENKTKLNLVKTSELNVLLEQQRKKKKCIERFYDLLKNLIYTCLRRKKPPKFLESPVEPGSPVRAKPFSILAELKKSLMAKKFILKLKRKFIEAILSKEQCILINDLSYDSVAPHIKKNSLLKKNLEQAFEGNNKFQITTFTKIFRKVGNAIKLFTIIIKPDEPFRVCVDLCSMFFIFYDSLQIPLLLSFDLVLPYGLEILANISQSFFLVDIYLNFQTAFYSKGTLIQKRKKIILNYIKIWFWIDCIASFPYDWVLNAFNNSNDFLKNSKLIRTFRFIKFIKVLRMLRLLKLKKILRKIENYVQLSNEINGFLVFFRLSFFIIVVAHWCACCWHLIATLEDDVPTNWLIDANLINSDWSEKYIGSLYWAITTMITVGYGDITPKTSTERVFAILVMLVASGMFAYTMNAIGSIFQNLDKSAQEYKEKIQCFDRYMISQQLPKEMIGRVKKYLEYVLEPDRTIRLTQNIFLQNLSDPLQKEVLQFINGKVLFKTDLFHLYFSKGFLMKLPFFLTENIYGPNEMIYNEKDIFNEKAIYFISNGSVNLISYDSNTVIKQLQRNNYFGEISFFSNILIHSCTAITTDFTNVFVLRKNDFLHLFGDPELAQDKEIFSYFQNKIDLYERYDGLGIICYSCGKSNHIAKRCPDIHVTIENVDVILKSLSQQETNRKAFKRKNLNNRFSESIKNKGFHALNDHLLIKEEALVHIKCSKISVKKYRQIDENNTDKSMKHHFQSILSENDNEENYETEDSKEFQPSIRDKIKLELGNLTIKKMSKLIENREDSFHSLQEKNSSPLSNKIKESALSLLLNRSRNNIIFDLTSIKNFDKIQIFSHYFPLNNFDKVVSKINKRADQELQKFKKNKNSEDKIKKILYENVIDQPVSSLQWRETSLTRPTIRKDRKIPLVCYGSHQIIKEEISDEENNKKACKSLKEPSINTEGLGSFFSEKLNEEKPFIEQTKQCDFSSKQPSSFLHNETLRFKSSTSRNFDGVPIKRSLSNESLIESMKNIQKTFEKSKNLLGGAYTKYLMEKCQDE